MVGGVGMILLDVFVFHRSQMRQIAGLRKDGLEYQFLRSRGIDKRNHLMDIHDIMTLPNQF
jgi:hypothetical protein